MKRSWGVDLSSGSEPLVAPEVSVLVVDDDRTASASLAAVLRGDGLQVLVANEPSEAMAIQYQQHPAAIVVDYQLADGSGLEVAQRLKVRDPQAAVLLLLGMSALESALEGIQGLDGMLVKPLVPQVFVQSLRNALTIRSLKEENRRLAEAGQSAEAAQSDIRESARPPAANPPDPAQFADRLGRALAESRSDGCPLGVVLVELRGYESIREQFGESAAEEVVAIAGLRLSSARRKSDLVARVSNDQLAVALMGIESWSDLRRVVRILLDEVEDPITVAGQEYWLNPTGGAVLTDPSSPSESVSKLLEDAAVALACARDEGRSWRLFDKSLQDMVSARVAVGVSIRNAMDHDELMPVYQPVQNIVTGAVVGAAVTFRWNRPNESVILSSDLLAQEGDLSLYAQVSAWMLDRAFAELAGWRNANWLHRGFRLALGVSAREVEDPQFSDTIEDLMEKHDIQPTMLSIDLSAKAARQAASGNNALARLGSAGALFTLDDFGSSDTGLAWLKDLPLSSLKLDSQLAESLDNPNDRRGTALVRSVIALGNALELTVVAKGVRTPTQRAALLAMGCELVQDSHYGRPGPPEHPWEPDLGSTAFNAPATTTELL